MLREELGSALILRDKEISRSLAENERLQLETDKIRAELESLSRQKAQDSAYLLEIERINSDLQRMAAQTAQRPQVNVYPSQPTNNDNAAMLAVLTVQNQRLSDDVNKLRRMLEQQQTKNLAVLPPALNIRRDTLLIRDTLFMRNQALQTAQRDTIIRYVEKERVVRDTIVKTVVERAQPIETTKTVVVKESATDELLALPSDKILFDFGKYALKPVYFARLDFYANMLAQHAELSLSLSGHTDNTGNKASNLELSRKRVESVATYLQQKGVALQRIKSSYMGQANPLDDNSTDTGKVLNRRVEVKFSR